MTPFIPIGGCCAAVTGPGAAAGATEVLERLYAFTTSIMLVVLLSMLVVVSMCRGFTCSVCG